jgi:hypothetical protein
MYQFSRLGFLIADRDRLADRQAGGPIQPRQAGYLVPSEYPTDGIARDPQVVTDVDPPMSKP